MDQISGILVRGIPLVKAGDDIASLISSLVDIHDGDVVCIASTVVAKSEGRSRELKSYTPSIRAEDVGRKLGKDPRFVQAVLEESAEILLDDPFLLVVTRFGHICINAGIDQSNVSDGRLLLLPENPSASAERIREGFGRDCAVIITDTCGRPFRCGVAGIAIGWSGIAALRDWRGVEDLNGRRLEMTLEAITDEIAGMANFMMGEAGDGTPAAVFGGLGYPRSGGTVFRPDGEDVIRRQLRRSRSAFAEE